MLIWRTSRPTELCSWLQPGHWLGLEQVCCSYMYYYFVCSVCTRLYFSWLPFSSFNLKILLLSHISVGSLFQDNWCTDTLNIITTFYRILNKKNCPSLTLWLLVLFLVTWYLHVYSYHLGWKIDCLNGNQHSFNAFICLSFIVSKKYYIFLWCKIFLLYVSPTSQTPIFHSIF